MRKSRPILAKNWEWRMFYSSNLNNLSVFVQFCTHTLQFICENSCLNSANFTCRVIFRVILENFSLAQKCYTQVSFVIVVTNSMSLYFPFGLFLFGLFVFLYFCLFAQVDFASSGLLESFTCGMGWDWSSKFIGLLRAPSVLIKWRRNNLRAWSWYPVYHQDILLYFSCFFLKGPYFSFLFHLLRI